MARRKGLYQGLYGNWSDVRYWANQTRRRGTVTKIRRALRELGDEIVKMFVQHIERQDLPWASLSEITLFLKAAAGHSNKIYYATGSYARGIHRKVTAPSEFQMNLLIYPAGVHRPSRLRMSRLAHILEYGIAKPKIPARPIWRVVEREVPDAKGYKTFQSSIRHIMLQRSV